MQGTLYHYDEGFNDEVTYHTTSTIRFQQEIVDFLPFNLFSNLKYSLTVHFCLF